MPIRSFISNLMSFVPFVIGNLDSGGQADSFYTDFMLAFDRVSYSILVAKRLVKQIRDRIPFTTLDSILPV